MTPQRRSSTTIGAAIDELQPWSACDLRSLARGVVVPVDPRRLSRLRHERQDVAAAENRASSHGHSAGRRAPASDRRCVAVAVIPADDGDVGVEQLADLHRDGIEDLARTAHRERRASRRAAALPALRRAGISSRDSAFAIAVATSSVNPASRISACSAHGSLRLVPAKSAPQSRPPTRIGAPTVACRSRARPIGPTCMFPSSYGSLPRRRVG